MNFVKICTWNGIITPSARCTYVHLLMKVVHMKSTTFSLYLETKFEENPANHMQKNLFLSIFIDSDTPVVDWVPTISP